MYGKSTEKVCSRRLWARKKCADTRNRPNEHEKSVLTAEHEHGKSVSIKYGHKWVPGLKSSRKPILGRTISPRSVRPTGGDAASRFWKRGELEDARLREGRACTRSHFPRFELRVKSCDMRRAKKRPNFRTRSRSPPTRVRTRPHVKSKNCQYLGYTAPPSPPATGKPTRPIVNPKQLSLK